MGQKISLVHFEEINYVTTKPEEEFHLETLNDENTDGSYSAHDAMSSSGSDEDNETTPESYYFIAHNLCITKKTVFKLEKVLLLNSPFNTMVSFLKKLGQV